MENKIKQISPSWDVLVCVRKMRHESTRGGHGGAETPVTLDMRHIRYRGFMGAAG